MEPKSETEFIVQFQPVIPGSYYAKLPLYVRNQMDGAVYNYIELEGIFPEASLTVSEHEIFMEPIPLKTNAEKEIEITASYHIGHCVIRGETNFSEINLNFKDEKKLDEGKITNKIRVCVQFSSKIPKVIDTHITFVCTCGVSCKVTVKACSENCTLTNHAFLKVFGTKAMNFECFTLTSAGQKVRFVFYLIRVTLSRGWN